MPSRRVTQRGRELYPFVTGIYPRSPAWWKWAAGYVLAVYSLCARSRGPDAAGIATERTTYYSSRSARDECLMPRGDLP